MRRSSGVLPLLRRICLSSSRPDVIRSEVPSTVQAPKGPLLALLRAQEASGSPRSGRHSEPTQAVADLAT
jgi:hypothetical protein